MGELGDAVMMTVFGESPHDGKSDCENVRALPRLDEVVKVIFPTLGSHLNETV